jgi:tripartite-type tricarboxylate transporter receptor subunit TctC
MRPETLTSKFLLCTAWLLAGATVSAQTTAWPERAVRVINPFPAGGASDNLTRIMAEELQKRLGQSFVVENRTGASGNIGMEVGAKAPPDGYTLLSATIGTLTINQHLYPRMPYDPESLGYISTFWSNCNVVMVPAQHNPSTSLKDFIAWGKARSQGISFGSSGIGTTPHLAGELFQLRTGVRSVHVPTRGGPQTVSLLLAGNIDVSIDNIASYAGFLANGQVRGLATTCPERWPTLPDIPTMAEAGMPDFVITSWGAFVAPAGTPQPILDKLSRTMGEVAADPGVQKRFLAAGARLVSSTPQETAAFAARERKRWGELVRTTGMKIE